jgi:predicted dehydrogenase
MGNTDRKLRVIVVGGGYFGKKRLYACQDLSKDIEVVGLVESDDRKAQNLSHQYHLTCKPNLVDYRGSHVDAAIICTPNVTHPELAIRALSLGWHVLCEKPLAINSVQAKKISSAAIRYHRFVKTGSNHRFFPPVQKAYHLVQSGKIGDILSFKGSIGNDGTHTANGWFWDKSVSGGGTFIDNGCHLIDLARMFMGDFSSCTGLAANVFWKKTAVEDIGTGIFVTGDGGQAVISSSWIQWRGYLYFELWGTKGFIIVDMRDKDTLTFGRRGETQVKTYDFSGEPKNSYHRELLYFKDCIFKNIPPKPDARDGARVIDMIEAVYTSNKTHKWVRLNQ